MPQLDCQALRPLYKCLPILTVALLMSVTARAAALNWHQQVHSELLAQWPEVDDLSLSEIDLPGDSACRDERVTQVSIGKRPLSPRVAARLEQSCGNGEHRTITKWLSVQARGDVWVAARDLPVGITLTPDLLVKRRVDLLQVVAPVRDETPLQGLETALAIQGGVIVTKSMLRRTPDVRVGQEVIVTVRVNRVHLSTKAISQNSAMVGEKVLVSAISSGAEFHAIVTGPGSAEARL